LLAPGAKKAPVCFFEYFPYQVGTMEQRAVLAVPLTVALSACASFPVTIRECQENIDLYRGVDDFLS
jgi:hypothetical protein